MVKETCTVLIPARMESSRLPGKPLKKIQGTPMIVHVAKRSALYEKAENVVVCTDSAEIILECDKYGVHTLNTKNDHHNGTTRIAEASMLLGLHDDDIVIDVQGDEPFVRPEYIQEVHEFLLKTDYGCCVPFQATEEYQNPNRVKIISSGNRVIYFTRADAPHHFSTPFSGFKKHLSIIGFKKSTLSAYYDFPIGELEQIEQIELFRLIENNVPIGTFEMPGTSISVDTPSDLELVLRTMDKDSIYQKIRDTLYVRK